MNMLLCFSSVLWIIHNENCISVSFHCWEITFQRVYTSIWDTLYLFSINFGTRIQTNDCRNETVGIRKTGFVDLGSKWILFYKFVEVIKVNGRETKGVWYTVDTDIVPLLPRIGVGRITCLHCWPHYRGTMPLTLTNLPFDVITQGKLARRRRTNRPLLWCRDNIVTSHESGPGFDPWSGQFPGWGFFRGFPSPLRQISGNLGHIRPRLSYGHHISSKPYIIRLWTATVSDHNSSTWLSLNNQQ